MPIFEDSFSCQFYVMTVHGSVLEFVLKEALERSKNPPMKMYSFGKSEYEYSEILWDMLILEFKNNRNISIPNMGLYGELSFEVRSDSYETLRHALTRCEKVVDKWIKKYNVNRMKNPL